ncbi:MULTISPECIES: hypothetical protein [unclassified Pseudoalteromonas]|uniref:hypothetical protein n=1 Tax=unclassified Pseudoalteromonas TaxID=194690 RepID=UPI0005AB8CAF|nr:MULTISPECIES: hypothetical protein [unclassified Pseudoalteromonas]
MKLHKSNTDLLFRDHSTSSDVQFGVYWKGYESALELEFSNSFISDSTHKWVLIFYPQGLDVNSLSQSDFDVFIDSFSEVNAAIIWLESTESPAYLKKALRLTLDGKRIEASRLDPAQHYTINKKVQFRRLKNSTIALNELGNLIITQSLQDPINFKINGGRCCFNELQIGITNKTGKLSFQSLFDISEKSMPIVVPLVSQTKREAFESYASDEDPVVSYQVADASGLVGQKLLASYLPFYNLSSCEFQLSPNSDIPITTQLTDSHGRQLKINHPNNLTFGIRNLQVTENEENHRRYFMVPISGTVMLDSQEMLLGYSGTESISCNNTATSALALTFSETNQVQYDDKDFSTEIATCYDSTSVGMSLNTGLDFNFDSQRAPLFPNQSSQATNKAWISNYKKIKKGTFTTEQVPLIPSLAFFKEHQEDLLNLEKIYSQQRINNAQTDTFSASTLIEQNHITPQGFIKSGPRYDFVNKDDIENQGFEFSIEGFDNDLELSIQKNEVFFVLTPELFRQYKLLSQSQMTLSAKFSVNNTHDNNLRFLVDLLDAYPDTQEFLESPTTHKNSIVIFKFHTKSLQTLLNDKTNCTNQGNLKKDLVTIIGETSTRCEKINETYFERVYKDSSWNGIVILDIPITGQSLPATFKGLASSQQLPQTESGSSPSSSLIPLKTMLKFQYVAIPVNKTKITDLTLEIDSTAFFGLIDYDPFTDEQDYEEIHAHLDELGTQNSWRFVLSKLRVVFRNSNIVEFDSYAFLRVGSLFESTVSFGQIALTHPKENYPGIEVEQLDRMIMLKGSYQKNEGKEEFAFDAHLDGSIHINNSILKAINVSQIGFSGNGEAYRFDINADVDLDAIDFKEYLSFEGLELRNLGLAFNTDSSSIPSISFDVSKLIAFPKISFNGEGFLSSFPLRFSHFNMFELDLNFKPINDYMTLPVGRLHDADISNSMQMYSLVFDFDMGTLGDLDFLKKLKGQLYIGWTGGNGLYLGMKLGPSSSGLDFDLFGALKVKVEELDVGTLNVYGECNTYFIRLKNASLQLFDTRLPSEENNFNGIIIADFSNSTPSKIAWLATYSRNEDERLLLGLGQRMGPPSGDEGSTTRTMLEAARKPFKIDLQNRPACSLTPNDFHYRPERNWLVATESLFGLFGSAWEKTVDLRFIFNDPVLYGIYIGINGENPATKGLGVDILYKKLSENLGLWSTEIQLPDAVRYQEFGALSVTFPNLGLDIYTNGDWKLDVGFPKNNLDWQRSCQLQLIPFVGWAGFYIASLKSVDHSIFSSYEDEVEGTSIVQVGCAIRIGLGKYFRKGPLYAGASISVYGVLEGAFAFENDESGLDKFFPDHFALRGRIGAIAEIIGYVDFKIVKASLHAFLQVEIGLLLAYINSRLMPAPLYIEGNVGVRIRVTISCFKIFRKKICIRITFSFSTTVRFQWTLGGSGSNKLFPLLESSPVSVPVNLEEIPVIYIPSVTKESNGNAVLVHNFAINFFGFDAEDNKTSINKNNILKKSIIDPIFKALINGENPVSSIEQLRSILSEDREDNPSHKLDFSSYVPTIYSGYDLDKITFDEDDFKHFRDIFGFDENEFEKFVSIQNSCETTPEQCPFRPLVAPIGHKLKVKTKDGVEKHFDSGFDISLENLFKDNQGNTSIVKSIDKLGGYTEGDINKIDKFFNGYKTQFIARQNEESALLDESDIELRYEYIINEYFELFGLLVLEACFNRFIDSYDHDSKPDASSVSVKYISNDGQYHFKFKAGDIAAPNDGLVNPNDVLEDVVGQINYFYSNGLRLPKREEDSQDITTPYWEYLKQTSDIIIPKSPLSQIEDVKVEFGNNKFGDDRDCINLRADLFEDNNDLLEFMDNARKNVSVNLSDIKKTFNLDKIISNPYKLIPASYGLINSTIKESIVEDSVVFLKFPEQLRSTQETKSYTFKLSGKSSDEVDFTPVANIDVIARVRQVDGRDIIEIQNVKIDELTLINLIQQSMLVQGCDLSMFRAEKDEQGGITLHDLGELTIVKTNLSKVTSPPIIISQNAMLSENHESKKYIASTYGDKQRFIELLRQALTTNNGGFYLLPQHSGEALATSEKWSDIHITCSVSFTPDNIPSYINYLKVKNNNQQLKLIDIFIKHASNEEYRELLDYHSIIPSHCVGFEIGRTLPDTDDAEHHKLFLPLEYGISSEDETMISKEKVLPIMPQSINSESDRALDPSKKQEKLDVNSLSKRLLYYKHVTPLSDQLTAVERYACVGKTYVFKFGLRDIYGHRTIDNIGTTVEHTHKYFDKLIPMSAWPMIKITPSISNELNSVTSSSIKFNAIIEVDREAYRKYQNSNGKEQIQSQLLTIISQLHDENCHMLINTDASERTHISDAIKNSIKDLLMNLYEENNIAVEASISIPYIITLDRFASTINADIEIIRKVEEELFVIATSNSIIDSRTIRSVKTPLVFDSASNKEDSLTGFAKLVDTITKSDELTVGIGSDGKERKLIYAIKTAPMDNLFESKEPYSRSAATPISNTLWSGEYNNTKYTDIDLDTSLRSVFNYIEDLLSDNNIASFFDYSEDSDNTSTLNELIQAKKELSKHQGFLSRKVELLSSKTLKASKLFDETLAKSLLSYYYVDGIVSYKINTPVDLQKYRLTVSVKDPVKSYDVTCSKIDSRNNGDLDILFDKTSNNDETDDGSHHSFSFTPQVTHIESDIDSSSELESSKWIQLIKPYSLLGDDDKLQVDLFPSITKKFPPKPLISHDFDYNKKLKTWGDNVGEWKYKLKINNSNAISKALEGSSNDYYVEGDKVIIKLTTETVNQYFFEDQEQSTFSAFVAHYASLIASREKIRIPEFIQDLTSAIPSEKAPLVFGNSSKNHTYTFWLVKQDNKWKSVEVSPPNPDNALKLFTTPDGHVNIENMTFNGPNILASDSRCIQSVLPSVYVIRNETGVENENFHYTTQKISTATRVIPLLEYSRYPLAIDRDQTFDDNVINKVPGKYRRKVTVKYHLNPGSGNLNHKPPRPLIPITQIEIEKNINEFKGVDAIYEGYQNGNEALTLTVSIENDDAESNQPIIHVDTIYRKGN